MWLKLQNKVDGRLCLFMVFIPVVIREIRNWYLESEVITSKPSLFCILITMKIETFINRIKVNRQFAQSTISSYTRTLKRFDDYLRDLSFNKRWVEDTDKIKVWDVEQFIWREKLRWKAAKTCNWYLACIRDFIAFAERSWEDVINYKQILLMKEPKRKIEALTENEVQKLLAYMRWDKTKDELTKTRDLAMVSVLLFTWLRVSELCNIKVEDVQNELQIIGKNSSLRLVYLFQEHLSLIRLYLFLRQGKHIDSEYLFCSHASNSKWKQLSRVTVEEIVKNAGIKAWLTNPVWPHKLRHTFATSLLRRWWNIYYIKELLGHQHITTTQTYLSATNNDLKKTQALLQQSVVEEESYEEKLMPMPENIIIKDKNLFEQFKNQWVFQSFQQQIGRGVPSYNWGCLG